MTHTARRTGYASLLSSLLVIALGLLLGGCSSWFRSKPGLLSDRGGLVPPPYETPATSASGMAGMMAMPSPQPAFPTILPAGATFAEEPAALVEAHAGAKVESVQEIVLPEAPVIAALTHTVAKGESLWLIAQKYGITYQELAGVNNLDPKAVLKVGQLLTIPPGGRPGAASENCAPTVRGPKTAKTAKKGGSAAATGAVSTYTVQNGDCLSKIAARCGTTTADLRQLNGLKSDTILIGQKLQVRGEIKGGAAPTTAKKDEPKKADPPTVEPKEGETLPQLTPTGAAPVADIPAVPTEGTAVAPPEVKPPEVRIDVVAPAPAGDAGLRNLPHDVCKDDTLENVAEMYGTTVQAILQANPEIKSNTDLKVGNTIMVPYK